MRYLTWVSLVATVVVTGLLYAATHDAGFVTDYTGLAARIETHGAAGILSSFGFPALQPLLSGIYYWLYTFGSTIGWSWWAVALTVHLLNGYLLYRLLRQMLSDTDRTTTAWIAGGGTLLFLWSPYTSEVLVWRVCLNYLLVSTGILATLSFTLAWLQRPSRRSWWWLLTCQAAALLIFELAIVIPLLSLPLIGWYTHARGQFRRAMLRLWAPQLSLVVLYFLANRLWLGSWIGHYGAEVHWRFPLAEMIANIGRYGVKWIAFSRYWPHGWKETVATGLASPLAIGILLAIAALLLFLIIKKFRTMSRPMQLALVTGTMTVIALLPVLNLYFNYLLHIENDRYGYLAAAFFYPAWIAVLAQLPRNWFRGIVIVYLAASVVLLWQTNRYWTDSTDVYRALLEDFPAFGRDTVYLLNLPDNLQGAPMFRDYSGQDGAFIDALQYVQGRSFAGQVYEVVQYNMVSPADGVTVQRDSTGIEVTFQQWGNWWWRRGIGAAGYRDSTYVFQNAGHHYRLEWRRSPTNAQLLYQDGLQWTLLR